MIELILLFYNIPIRLLDIIDVLLVALLLFQLYKLIKGTAAINIFIGIIALYLIWKLVNALEMELLGELLGQFISVGVLALFIVFQQEIRKFLLLLGNPKYFNKGPFKYLFSRWRFNKEILYNIDSIVQSCYEMRKNQIGALIVIAKQNELQQYIDTGEILEARISKQLIENIFYKNTPLHDGAIIIKDNKIIAARCILPISERTDIPESYGLRHRAAIGITEHSDAITILVSEQTGYISYCKEGNLINNVKLIELKNFLKQEFKN